MLYVDIERDLLYTEEQLKTLYDMMKDDNETDCMTFEEYIKEATGKNGSLEKIDDEKVNEMLTEKIENIFLEMQSKLGIKYGDVAPWDAIQLENKTEELSRMICFILAKQI
jgi:hypothetical protein